MKKNIWIISVLTIVCLSCGYVLSFAWTQLKDTIADNEKKYLEKMINQLEPEAATNEPLIIEGDTIYKLFDSHQKPLGYAFIAQGQGYQDKIVLLAAVNTALTTLKGIQVLDSKETPGLGAKITKQPFRDQFKLISLTEALECVKMSPAKGNQIQAITSATVSSRAVVKILNERIMRLRSQIKEIAQ